MDVRIRIIAVTFRQPIAVLIVIVIGIAADARQRRSQLEAVPGAIAVDVQPLSARAWGAGGLRGSTGWELLLIVFETVAIRVDRGPDRQGVVAERKAGTRILGIEAEGDATGLAIAERPLAQSTDVDLKVVDRFFDRFSVASSRHRGAFSCMDEGQGGRRKDRPGIQGKGDPAVQ